MGADTERVRATTQEIDNHVWWDLFGHDQPGEMTQRSQRETWTLAEDPRQPPWRGVGVVRDEGQTADPFQNFA
jgi:hypothetical protein